MAKNILKDLHIKLFSKKEENKNKYRIGLTNGHVFQFVKAELDAQQDLHIFPIAQNVNGKIDDLVLEDYPQGLTVRHDDISWIADLGEPEVLT